MCGPEQVEKCRWVVRNENKQVEERVCSFVDKKVSWFLYFFSERSTNVTFDCVSQSVF